MPQATDPKPKASKKRRSPLKCSEGEANEDSRNGTRSGLKGKARVKEEPAKTRYGLLPLVSKGTQQPAANTYGQDSCANPGRDMVVSGDELNPACRNTVTKVQPGIGACSSLGLLSTPKQPGLHSVIKGDGHCVIAIPSDPGPRDLSHDDSPATNSSCDIVDLTLSPEALPLMPTEHEDRISQDQQTPLECPMNLMMAQPCRQSLFVGIDTSPPAACPVSSSSRASTPFLSEPVHHALHEGGGVSSPGPLSPTSSDIMLLGSGFQEDSGHRGEENLCVGEKSRRRKETPGLRRKVMIATDQSSRYKLQVQQLEERLALTEKEVTQLREDNLRISENIAQLSTEKAQADKVIAQLSMEKAQADKVIAQLSMEKAQADKVIAQLSMEKAQADKVIAQLSMEKAQADKVIAQLSTEKAHAEKEVARQDEFIKSMMQGRGTTGSPLAQQELPVFSPRKGTPLCCGTSPAAVQSPASSHWQIASPRDTPVKGAPSQEVLENGGDTAHGSRASIQSPSVPSVIGHLLPTGNGASGGCAADDSGGPVADHQMDIELLGDSMGKRWLEGASSTPLPSPGSTQEYHIRQDPRLAESSGGGQLAGTIDGLLTESGDSQGQAGVPLVEVTPGSSEGFVTRDVQFERGEEEQLHVTNSELLPDVDVMDGTPSMTHTSKALGCGLPHTGWHSRVRTGDVTTGSYTPIKPKLKVRQEAPAGQTCLQGGSLQKGMNELKHSGRSIAQREPVTGEEVTGISTGPTSDEEEDDSVWCWSTQVYRQANKREPAVNNAREANGGPSPACTVDVRQQAGGSPPTSFSWGPEVQDVDFWAKVVLVYETFPWQKDAIEFADWCNTHGSEMTARLQHVAARNNFNSYGQRWDLLKKRMDSLPRSDPLGSECEAASEREEWVRVFTQEYPTQGGSGYTRRFIAANYKALWKRSHRLPAVKRHFYEVIRSDQPCHLYFDLEFNRLANPEVDGSRKVDFLIDLLEKLLRQQWGICLAPEHLVELDSSTEEKFSRHLVVRLPGFAFTNNLVAGQFVSQIRNHPDALEHLYVRKTPGDDVTYVPIIDPAVYSRHRHFRIVWSCKGGKTACLQPTDRFFHSPGSPKLSSQQIFLASCITNVHPSCQLLSLPHTTPKCSSYYRAGPSPQVQTRRGDIIIDYYPPEPSKSSLEEGAQQGEELSPSGGGQATSATSRVPSSGDHVSGPRPIKMSWTHTTVTPETEDQKRHLQQLSINVVPFIEDVSKRRAGGLATQVRSIAYCGDGAAIAYSTIGPGSHWCENIGRCHKRNHVFFIVDLLTGRFSQKCHDPDCAGYRSPWLPLPAALWHKDGPSSLPRPELERLPTTSS